MTVSRINPLQIEMRSTLPPKRCGVAEFCHSLSMWLPKVCQDITVTSRPLYPDLAEVADAENKGGLEESCVTSGEQRGNLPSKLVIFHYEPRLFEDPRNLKEALVLESHVCMILHNLPHPASAQEIVLRLLLKKSILCIVPLPALIEEVRARYGFQGHIYQFDWPYISDGATVTHTQQEAREQLGITSNCLLLTYGFLSPWKGVEGVLRALKSVVDSGFSIQYAVIGTVQFRFEARIYSDSIITEAASLGLAENLILDTTYQSQSALDVWMNACDYYVCPHIVPIGARQLSSGTIPHALSFGKPVLATPIDCARELLDSGSGFVFEHDTEQLSETVVKLMSNKWMSQNAGANAASHGRRLTMEVFASRLVSAADECLQSLERG